MNILNEKITAIEKVHNEFVDILKNERCRTCACFHTDMLAVVLDAIGDVKNDLTDDKRIDNVEKDFLKWIENAEKINLHH